MKKRFINTLAALAIGAGTSYGQIPLAEERVVIANERRVNSEELEFSPVFYKEGIVFISTRFETVWQNVKDRNANGVNIMSIYWSERDDEGFLQEPQPFANELIFRLHEGPVSFDKTADLIFFTRNESLEAAPDGFKKLQVYSAKKYGQTWADISKLPFNNVNFNFCHPAISVENDFLVVASDLPGGYGGMDLYVARKNGEVWSNLENLGETVNTPGNEVFPYLAADGTLYFSSDGHTGLGNLDLFYATSNGTPEKWSQPVNLGAPFNSPTDDFGFIVDRDNKNGYFSSDRSGGFGSDDIYNFYIEGDVMSPIAGGNRNLDGLVVLDENGNPIADVAVSAIHFNDVSLSAGDERVVKLTPGDGKDEFILDVNSEGMGRTAKTDAEGKTDLTMRGGNHVLKITKDGYLPQYITITPETDLSQLKITLQKAADCIAIYGQVLRQSGGAPIAAATVQIVDVDSKEAITVYSDAKGNYEYCVPCNRTFSVYAQINGATSAPGIANMKGIPCTPGSKINLPLYIGGGPLYAGMNIRLPNVYFNFDDAKLRPDAYRDLDEVVGMMNDFPGMVLELASHTDSRGVAAYNLDLSKRRSASVLKYLVSKGVALNRLVPRGYGEGQIRNRCVDGVACREADHQYNRRTEVKILEMGGGGAADNAPVASVDRTEEPGYADASPDFPAGEKPDADKGGQEVAIEADEVKEPETKMEKSVESGNFAVVAGTFANHDFAIRRATLLTNLGYSDASIVKQDSNNLYAVWVDSFEGKKEAMTLVKKLAQQQLSAYVLRR
jgi:outer membrane protein OmpA-like peptidoglycan-associated protein